jgi:hypothetical protein
MLQMSERTDDVDLDDRGMSINFWNSVQAFYLSCLRDSSARSVTCSWKIYLFGNSLMF